MEDYKLIPLSRGLFAKVDVADYEWLSQWKWTAWECATPGKFYAKRVETAKRTRKLISMHRLIINAAQELEVDHRNDDSLDNRRENLREATRSQNRANIKKFKHARGSRYKGVSFHPQNKNWNAYIQANGKRELLGVFQDEIEAAFQYDRAALEVFGKFARFNFPEALETTAQRPFKIQAKTTSVYRGVSWIKINKKWGAYIRVDRKTKNLGSFNSEVEAARTYDLAAKEAWGEKARLNFP